MSWLQKLPSKKLNSRSQSNKKRLGFLPCFLCICRIHLMTLYMTSGLQKLAKTVVHRFKKLCSLTACAAIGFLCFTGTCAIAAPVNLTSAELSNLISIKAQAESNYKEWQQANDSLKSKRDELEVLNKEVDSLSKQITSIQTELKKLNDLDVASPGAVNPTKLAQVRRDNESLFNERGQKSTQVKKLTDEIDGLVKAIKSKSGLDQQFSDKYKVAINSVVDRVMNERKSNYLKTQNVEASGTVSCGAMSVLDCKDKSLKEAERLAIERGSVIYIDSITEINNSKLTKDQIRSATKGQISNRQILEAKFVSDDTAYKTTIRADVTPVLGPEILAGLRADSQTEIEAMIGGGLPKREFAAEAASKNSLSVTSISDIEDECRSGLLMSCHELGVVVLEGGVDKLDYNKAIELLENACAGGSLFYCANQGFSEKENYAKSIILYQMACDGGNFDGCSGLSDAYIKGFGVKQDYTKAFSLAQKACDGGSLWGCANLGKAMQWGFGIKPDSVKAFALYLKACEGGNSLGCNNLNYLGRVYSTDLSQKYCEDGRADICALLGYSYSGGYGVQQDYDKAVDMFQKACDGGNFDGCSGLANSYIKGFGVKQDYTKAFTPAKKACDGGNLSGCNNLAYFYYLRMDYINSAELSQLACERGNPQGCNDLSNLYFIGRGVKRDYAKSAELSQKACDGGNAMSCVWLGSDYQSGFGVPMNNEKALALYQRACKLKSYYGCDNYAKLKKIMGI